MKKKVLAIALAVALIAIMVSGSLAYFTANDEVSNTFTVGSVKIDIYENGAATDADTIPFGKLTPVVNTANPSADASYLKKVVTVGNTGSNAAYIRTHIAIPTDLVGYLYLDLTADGNWIRQADSTARIGTVDYTVFTYDYNAAVQPGAFTSELLKGVYLGSMVDLEEDANGNLVFILRDSAGKVTDNSGVVAHTKNGESYTSSVINVLVASQAIQTDGFDGQTVTQVLNTGFPAHPWAN